jgi:two-component system, OmpR family, sensor kinase
MGRLFWKFFLFFFFAQLTTALGVGAFIQFNADVEARKNLLIDQSPISQSLIDAAQSTLKFGGIPALKLLLQRWESQHLMHHVYVVDENNQDLLKRIIDERWIEDAAKAGKADAQATAKVKLENGSSYLFFVTSPRAFNERSRQPPSPERMDGDIPPDFDRPPHEFRSPPGHDFNQPPPHQTSNTDRIVNIFKTFPIKALLIGAIASALFAAMLAWYFSKPINNLRQAFKQAADGNLNVRAADKMGSRKDELSDLGHHFDFMASRLSALLQGQTRLLHHVSHELRSPLARMHMALGLASQNPSKVESSLNRIGLEAERMDKLIGELLELSRFESGMVDIKKEQFSLSELLETIIEDAAFEASSKQIKIVSDIKQTVMYQGQEDLMYRAIENVVRNAVKYAPPESTININLNQHDDVTKLSVCDQGSGVLETELDDIFKPFVRGYSGSQVVGHGVGLAIAKQVIEAHGGNIVARNLKPYGFCVMITLPTLH